jgi:hypothetical protein
LIQKRLLLQKNILLINGAAVDGDISGGPSLEQDLVFEENFDSTLMMQMELLKVVLVS